MEDSRGVVGAPLDETAFDFEPDLTTLFDEPPVLDGIPEVPEHISLGLAPYLAGRQARIATVDSSQSSLVVLTRIGEVSQAYRVTEPLHEPQQLTYGTAPVAQALLVPGQEQQLLFRRDKDGDEQYQIYRLAIDTGLEERLSDGRSRHGNLSVARNGQLAFSNNRRIAGDMDVYVASMHKMQKVGPLVERGGQWMAGAWSRNGERLLVRNYRSADSSSVYVADPATGQLEMLSLGKSEAVMRDARFAADAESVYVVSDAGTDVAELYYLDLISGEAKSLTAGLAWDVELVAVAQDRASLAFVTNEDGYSVLYFLNATTGEKTRVSNIPRGVISTLQFVGTSSLVAMTIATASEPADAFFYDKLVRWTESAASFPHARTQTGPELIRYTGHDGRQIPAFVYRPQGAGPFPVLLWIHGGPEAQHRPSFDPLLQYFVAELGIAVIAPNIRGSTGYGRQYLGLDDGVKRGDAVADIGALLDWIQLQADLNEELVGIYGASYGGFIVLAALVKYGERLAAGCDLVGISHFVSFLSNTSEYRRDARRIEYGDERDEEVREVLEQVSPLSRADQIRTPLLVGHGANDPRVPLAEAEQIVSKVRSAGTDVWYFLARDEGHGFRKRRSRDLFYATMATFFEKYLVAPQMDEHGVEPPDSAQDSRTDKLESSEQ